MQTNTNIIKYQWIVKRKLLLGNFEYRLLVLLDDGKYFLSNGESGGFVEVAEVSAKTMIKRDL